MDARVLFEPLGGEEAAIDVLPVRIAVRGERTAVRAGDDGQALIWSVPDGALWLKLQHRYGVESLAFSRWAALVAVSTT